MRVSQGWVVLPGLALRATAHGHAETRKAEGSCRPGLQGFTDTFCDLSPRVGPLLQAFNAREPEGCQRIPPANIVASGVAWQLGSQSGLRR